MQTLFKVLGLIAVIGFLYLIKDVLAILFVALLLILLLQPSVRFISSKGIPKPIAVLLMYILSLGALVAVFSLVVPAIIKETEQAVVVLEQYSAQTASFFGITLDAQFNDATQALAQIKEFLPNATRDLFSQLSNFVRALVTVAVVLVITFYGLVEEDAFKKAVRTFVPSQYQPYLYHLASRVQRQLGLWMRAQLLLALFIFCMIFVGLSILGVQYALVLALLAGVLEFIPYVGPILTGFTAIALTFFANPLKALLVLILFIVIQQVENHILVPKVMQKTTGLNPLISITALLIGARLAGFVGLLLAIPVTLALSVLLEDFVTRNASSQTEVEL